MSLRHTQTLSLSLYLIHTYTHTNSISLIHTHTNSLSLSLPLSLSLSFSLPLSLSLLCCRVEEWHSVSAPVCCPLCQQMTPPCSSQVVMPCLIFHAPSTLSICFLCVCVLSLPLSLSLSLSPPLYRLSLPRRL